MDRKIAVIVLLAVCVVLALLLLSGVIAPIVGALLFAVALVVLGVLSGGFRKQQGG